MATAVVLQETELIEYPSVHNRPSADSSRPQRSTTEDPAEDDEVPTNATEAIPDGGYGWVIVLCCSTLAFLFNGWSGSWGVLQTALLKSNTLPRVVDSGTTSFVGALSNSCAVAFGLFATRIARLTGARYGALLGIFFFGLSVFLTSFTVDNIGALFCTAGVLNGMGASLLYTISNAISVQYFSSKLGTANGLIKLGGGIGAAILSVVLQSLIDEVGIRWACRAIAMICFVVGVPSAWFIKERTSSSNVPFVDMSMFKKPAFLFIFLAGAIGTFPLFVPPYFLPLFAHSIGLSGSTGAGLVAGFSICAATGRMAAGFACDKLGSMNTILITMCLNSVSMLAIWPISNTLGPLILFSAVNGIANGAFFVAMPTAIATLAGPGLAAVAMSTAITGWTIGYLLGSPIAGFLISATNAEKSSSIEPYRAAIFYAGGVALLSGICVLVARLRLDTKIIKKL